MYWRLKSIPELRDLPPSQRRGLWFEANRTPLRAVDLLWLLLWFISMAPMFWLIFHLSLHGWKSAFLYMPMFFFYQQIFFHFTVIRARPTLRLLRDGGGKPLYPPSEGMTWPRYLCVVGAAFWIMAAPGLLGK